MFEHLSATKMDPILGLMAAYRADPREQKIDLGVGVYMNDRGHTPVMRAVKDAEARLMELEDTKAYQGIAGDPRYNELTLELLLGAQHRTVAANRVRTLQAPGGSGALRVGGELIFRAKPNAKLWIGVPTWPNHVPLLSGAGLAIEQYPYYDIAARKINSDAMMETLRGVPAGDIVLLHGCCHNPTGADLSKAQWDEIGDLALERGFIPYIDTAYQGLGEGLEADAYGVRSLAEKLPEMIIASSCSKNFGLYRERTGSITFVSATPAQADIVASQAMSVARQIYSMPPAHGALLVALILGDDQLCSQWSAELDEVRDRINAMRRVLTERIQQNDGGLDFSHIQQQRGMFSFLGISTEQVDRLREQYGIYIVSSTRVNLAGINTTNIDYLAESMRAVLA
jgi:aspartate aminotransferase